MNSLSDSKSSAQTKAESAANAPHGDAGPRRPGRPAARPVRAVLRAPQDQVGPQALRPTDDRVEPAQRDGRLITPVQEKNTTRYELAHERIIPPLRRLALKEITDVEKAQQTLDRRVNEWIGNNRVMRYLLTFEARET